MLFWDVLYTTIPGAFETPYQTAPLDLAQDCFYLARKVLIDARLDEIRAGHAKEILERHDTEYRPKQSWGVGVKWDLCEREDLVEIVEVSERSFLLFLTYDRQLTRVLSFGFVLISWLILFAVYRWVVHWRRRFGDYMPIVL